MQTHNLLWTSGWDSTFRLLQIILIEKEIVKPIYVIDKNRKSLSKELEAIKKILEKTKELFPEAYDRILPVWYVDENFLINETIEKSAKHINTLTNMGSQHIWLAQFCFNHNLKNVELSLDKNSNIKSFTHFLLTNYISTNYTDSENKELYNTIDILFQYFSFPVLHLSKQEMHSIVKIKKWEDIMKLTWFCHKPKRNKPCGKCVPCITVINKEMGFRIPLKNRLQGHLKIFLKK